MTVIDAFGKPLEIPSTGVFSTPAVGDIFVITTEGIDRGLVVVSATFDTPYVFAWVTTTQVEEASFPAFRISDPEAEIDLTVWPETEFGLSLSALGRRVGSALDSRTIHIIRQAAEHKSLDPHVDFHKKDDSEESLRYLSKVVDTAWLLGEWKWPTTDPGSLLLVPDFQRRVEQSPEAIGDFLGVPASRVVGILQGKILPNAREWALLLELSSESRENVLETIATPIDASDDASASAPLFAELSNPRFKEDVHSVMQKLNMSESDARTAIWQESFRLAARQDKTNPAARTRDRLTQAVRGLLDRD